MIEVLVVQPNKLPEKKVIPNELESFQKIVGGYIEKVYFHDRNDVVIICNEEGKLMKLEPNRDIGTTTICGNFFIAGVSKNNGELHSLTKNQFKEMMYRFDETSLDELKFKINYEKKKNVEREV